MSLFEVNPNLTWLFVFTHPDDDLSITAFLRRLARAGATVHVSWSHSNLEREDEARDVMGVLGIPAHRLHFHRSPDGYVLEDVPRLVSRFKAMLDTTQPDRIVVGAYEQGHIDHDATHYALSRAQPGPVLETPLYHTYAQRIPTINRFADPTGAHRLDATDDERGLKAELPRRYASQPIADYLIWYDIMRRMMLEPSNLQTWEWLRECPNVDYFEPNLPDALKAKVLKHPLWARWTQAIRSYEQQAL